MMYVSPQSHMELWDSLCKTDPKHTRGFSTRSGFKGTTIDAMWLVKRMTETFGPAGSGWGWDQSTREVSVPMPDGQIEMLAIAMVKIWWWDSSANERRYVPEQTGSAPLVLKRKRGPLLDEEAHKKATTNAFEGVQLPWAGRRCVYGSVRRQSIRPRGFSALRREGASSCRNTESRKGYRHGANVQGRHTGR